VVASRNLYWPMHRVHASSYDVGVAGAEIEEEKQAYAPSRWNSVWKLCTELLLFVRSTTSVLVKDTLVMVWNCTSGLGVS
jgi:hypothetical protein